MSNKTKIIISVVAVIVVICAIAITSFTVSTTSNIAKNIESEYDKLVSLVPDGNENFGAIKCSGGMSVKCSIDSIRFDETDGIYAKNIELSLKGTKKRANISFGLNFLVGEKSDIAFMNNSHISCELNNKIENSKSLLKNDIICNIKDSNNNKYSYSVSKNYIGELFKDTDFTKLVDADNRKNVIKAFSAVEAYLNELTFSSKVVNKEKNFIDQFVDGPLSRDYERDQIVEYFKNFQNDEKYKALPEDSKKIFDLGKKVFIDGSRNINFKMKSSEENLNKTVFYDIFGFDVLERMFSGRDIDGYTYTFSAD